MTSIKQAGTLLTTSVQGEKGQHETLLITSPAATGTGGLRLVSHADSSKIERVYILLARDPEWVRQAHDAVVAAGAIPRWVGSPAAMITSARTDHHTHGVLVVPEAIPARTSLDAGFRCVPFDPGCDRQEDWSRTLGQSLCRAELEGIWAHYQKKQLDQEEMIPDNLRIEPDTAPIPDDTSLASIWSAFKDIEQSGSTERVRVAIVEGPSGSGKESVSRLLCLAWHRRSSREKDQAVSHAGTSNHESLSLASLTETLARGDIVGIVKGAATDAIDRPGIFERVDRGGSVHLDEVAKSSDSVQAAMLRILSEGMVRREGGRTSKPIAPMFVVLSTATGPHHKKRMLTDLRSRGRENVIELPSLSRLGTEVLPGVVGWLATRHGIAFVSDAALHVFEKYRHTEMRELGFAVRIASERAKARLGGITCKRYYMMKCDVPVPPEAPIEKDESAHPGEQRVNQNSTLKLVCDVVRTVASKFNKEPEPHIRQLTQHHHEKGPKELLKDMKEKAPSDGFAKAVLKALWDQGEAKITVPQFQELLGVKTREFKVVAKTHDFRSRRQSHNPPKET